MSQTTTKGNLDEDKSAQKAAAIVFVLQACGVVEMLERK